MNKQKIIIIGLTIVILGCIILSVIMIKNNHKEEPINNDSSITNEEIIKDTEIEGLKITNQFLIATKDISTFKAIITNNTNETIEFEKLIAIFTIEDKKIELVVLGKTTIEPNEEKRIDITTEEELNNVSKIEYKIEK